MVKAEHQLYQALRQKLPAPNQGQPCTGPGTLPLSTLPAPDLNSRHYPFPLHHCPPFCA